MDYLSVDDAVYATIKKYNMLQPGDKLIAGVSGGPDSVCMLHVLNSLKDKLEIELFAAHLNHGIRGDEAEEDQRFVEDFAFSLGLHVFTRFIDVKELAQKERITVEEAGRQARYAFFHELLAQTGANKIAVGHNLNDSVETMLINLIRGSGPEGLKGIEPVRGSIVRPLIESVRENIEAYCRENALQVRFDSTNAEPIFTRNKVRLQLIPYLKENFNPGILYSLCRTSQLIYDENELLRVLAEQSYEECVEYSDSDSIQLKLDKLNTLHIALKRRVLRIALEKVKGSLKEVEMNHIEQALRIAECEKTGRWIRIPGNVIVKISYGRLIAAHVQAKETSNYSYLVPIPGEIEISETGARLTVRIVNSKEAGQIGKSHDICLLDYQMLSANKVIPRTEDSGEPQMVVRNRRNGDVIKPSGMKGTKKLKDYFIDEKIPREQRSVIPLIAVGNEVIWVVGRRYSERYRVNNQTKEVLVLEYESRE